MQRTDYAFEIEVKAADDGTKAPFTGIASTADEDLVGDIIEAGAFGTIKPGRVALLRDHNPTAVVGGWKSFEQSGRKLLAEGVISLKTALGQETYELLKDGYLTGLSVGYRILPGGATYNEKSGVRQIKSAKLLETSIVSVPANDRARISFVKSGLDTSTTPQWLRDNGFDEDEVTILMEKGFNALLAREAKGEGANTASPDLSGLLAEFKGWVADLKGSLHHA